MDLFARDIMQSPHQRFRIFRAGIARFDCFPFVCLVKGILKTLDFAGHVFSVIMPKDNWFYSIGRKAHSFFLEK